MSESEKVVVYQTEQITLWCHPQLSLIEHAMHRPISGPPLQRALDAGIEAMKKYQATKWLSDDRNNGPLGVADVKYGTEVWFPATKRAGWRVWALVQPQNLIHTLNLKKLVWTYTDQGVKSEVFSEPAQAREWILAQG